MLILLLHCALLIRGYKKHVPIKKVKSEDNKWRVVFDAQKNSADPLQLGMMNMLSMSNESDPFVDLNDARERTQSWLGTGSFFL